MSKKQEPRAKFTCDECLKECETYEKIETEEYEMWGTITTSHERVLLSDCCHAYVVTTLNLD